MVLSSVKGGGTPKLMVGLFHGKSEQNMDDGWGVTHRKHVAEKKNNKFVEKIVESLKVFGFNGPNWKSFWESFDWP